MNRTYFTWMMRRWTHFLVGTLASTGDDAVRLTTLWPRARQTTLPRNKLRGVYRIVGVQRLGS